MDKCNFDLIQTFLLLLSTFYVFDITILQLSCCVCINTLLKLELFLIFCLSLSYRVKKVTHYKITVFGYSDYDYMFMHIVYFHMFSSNYYPFVSAWKAPFPISYKILRFMMNYLIFYSRKSLHHIHITFLSHSEDQLCCVFLVGSFFSFLFSF